MSALATAGRWLASNRRPWTTHNHPTRHWEHGIHAADTLALVATAHGETEEEALANAGLIAAAPDLLKELRHLVRLLQVVEHDGGLNVPGLATLNGARAALAKAEGKQ